ncbi:MAG: hypothetical protein IPL41_13230 [Micropruina sp.]|nr:hypothetical protein [Micropruina sp.]
MRDEHDDQPDDESYLLLLPLEPGPDEPWVLAAPFRAHVLHSVEAAGIPWPAFAIETGIPVQAIRSLLFGRQGRPLKRLTPRLAARLLRVQPADLHGLHRTYVCADVTAHRLGALLRGGVDPLRLARWCDLSPHELARLVDGEAPSCSRVTEALALAAERMMLAPVLGQRAA